MFFWLGSLGGLSILHCDKHGCCSHPIIQDCLTGRRHKETQKCRVWVTLAFFGVDSLQVYTICKMDMTSTKGPIHINLSTYIHPNALGTKPVRVEPTNTPMVIFCGVFCNCQFSGLPGVSQKAGHVLVNWETPFLAEPCKIKAGNLYFKTGEAWEHGIPCNSRKHNITQWQNHEVRFFFCRGHIVSLLQFASRFLLLRSCSGQGWKERGRGKVFSAQRRQRKASLPAPIVVFRAFLPVKAVTLCRIGKKKPLCRSLQRRHPKSFLQSLHPCQCLVPRCLLCLPGLPCLCAWSAMWWWKCHVLLLHQLTACPIPATVVTVMMR